MQIEPTAEIEDLEPENDWINGEDHAFERERDAFERSRPVLISFAGVECWSQMMRLHLGNMRDLGREISGTGVLDKLDTFLAGFGGGK